MKDSNAIVNEEPVNERHDGADLCPMCLTELLLPANSCPKCGAPVNAAGIIEPPPAPQKRLHNSRLMIWLHAITALCFLPSVANPTRSQWLFILVISLNVFLTLRAWRDYRAVKAELEPTST